MKNSPNKGEFFSIFVAISENLNFTTTKLFLQQRARRNLQSKRWRHGIWIADFEMTNCFVSRQWIFNKINKAISNLEKDSKIFLTGRYTYAVHPEKWNSEAHQQTVLPQFHIQLVYNQLFWNRNSSVWAVWELRAVREKNQFEYFLATFEGGLSTLNIVASALKSCLT